jgi:hypothetical protein
MFNHFDRLQPTADIVIGCQAERNIIHLSFARPLDVTLLEFISFLERQAPIWFIDSRDQNLTVYLNGGYSTPEVAEAIAKTLKEEHKLTIQRRLYRTPLMEDTLVESFTPRSE